MGFYIRKSISAGPFRFNLSSSGLGMSVGVKGFRIGTGPRGNYVHMGRGGLYYRASLGSISKSDSRPANLRRPAPIHSEPPSYDNLGIYAPVQVETGNVLEMKAVHGVEIVDQINEKLRLLRFWPWSLIVGLFLSALLASNAQTQMFAVPMVIVMLVVTAVLFRWDQVRKAVVVMYHLDDQSISVFKAFADQFELLSQGSRKWNIDTAQLVADQKRNAGAGRTIGRKAAQFTYGVPSVVKTNVSIPAIIGGRQSIFFFPDSAIVVEGNRAGSISYHQLNIYWGTTVFIERDGVPSDSQVVGYTWQYVNKGGGPDRRFKNNRQIPEVLYQQMGLRGPGEFQKVMHVSRVEDRAGFDRSLNALRGMVRNLQNLALTAPQ